MITWNTAESGTRTAKYMASLDRARETAASRKRRKVLYELGLGLFADAAIS